MLRVFLTIFLFRFFVMASPIVGMFSVFMFESNNTPIQMAIVFASFMLAVNLFEVPSSVIADRFSRKMVIISAIILVMLSNIVFLYSQNHWAFVFHMVIAGIGVALFSGTVEAFTYDELVAINKQEYYPRFLAGYHVAWSLGLSASLFLSAWLIKYGWHTIVVVSLFMCFASLVIFTIGAKETKRIKEIGEASSLKAIILEGGKTILHNKTVQYLAIISVIYGAINCVFGDVAIITSIELGWEKAEIARFFGLNTIWEGLITVLFAKYCKKVTTKHIKYVLSSTLVLCVIGMAFGQKWSIFFVLPLWWMDRLKNIVLDPKIQEQVRSSSRATVASCINMFFGMKYIVLMLALGLIASWHSFAIGFVIIALFGICGFITLSFYKRKAGYGAF